MVKLVVNPSPNVGMHIIIGKVSFIYIQCKNNQLNWTTPSKFITFQILLKNKNWKLSSLQAQDSLLKNDQNGG